MKNMFIMLLAMLYVVSAYAQDFEVDGLSYQVTKSPDGESPGEVEVTGGEIKEEIEFPETVTYNSATYMVTSIGSNAFSGRSNSGNFTKKYIIPGTVRSIGNSAFYDNYYLEEVEFNEGLQTIGVDAFGYNFALKEIRIPSTVTAIEDRAFRTNQQNQATISCLAATPPANLGSETFQGRTDATLHVVAADVEAYQETEYWKDFSVISGDILNINRCSSPVITCDNNILTISCKTEGAAIYYTTDGSVPDENAIRYTSPISYTTNQIIRAIAIAEGYENSSVKNFYDKELIENVTDEQGVKYTLKQADDGCFYYSVTGHSDELNAEIVIPSALDGCPVKTIGGEAFKECTSLSSITIPSSVTNIGARAFLGCSALKIVTSEISTPFAVDAFSLFDATLVIPKDSRTNYESVGGWEFAFIYEEGENIYPQEQTDEQGVKYALRKAEDNSLYYSVTGHADELNAEIVIPADLGGCPVKIIEEKVFEGCTDLSSITISNSVTTIGARAFYGCSNLSTVILGSQLMTIGEYVFGLCTSLSSITIPNSVTTIGKFAFDSCSSLTSITIGNNVTALRGGTFYYCTSLTDINVPNSVTIIESEEEIRWRWLENIGNPGIYGVFEGCSSLSSVTIPNSVTSIGDDAFRGCSGITMVTSEISTPFAVDAFGESNANNATLVVPQGSRTAYQSADGWNGFAFIYEEGETIYAKKQTDEQGLYYTLKQADDGSFYYSVTGHSDEMDTEIVIPAKLDGCLVKTIGDNAFSSCTDLTSVKIGNGVSSIGNNAFAGCENLTSVKMGKNVIGIGDEAFRSCANLTSITLPDVLESIGAHAFQYTPLTSVNIPESVKTIGDEAFRGCGSLASVGFEEGLTSIGDGAFRECALTSVTIPNSVTSIGEWTFSYNRSLTTAILGDDIEEIKSYTFFECSALSSVIIPDGVTSIGSSAFSGCHLLTSIKLPESLTSLGGSALPGAMKSIELPNAFTVISEGLFYSNNFQYIKLGNKVKSIGKNAFGSSEMVIEIGTSTPPTIASDAFPNVEYLSDLNVIVPNAAAETVYRKKAVWEEMTFSNKENISEVTVNTPGDLSIELIMECGMMPAKVVDLKVNGTINADDFTQMLVNMKSLLRLDLSDCDITEIPDDAMSGKTQLQELTLPTGLQIIGKRAFQNCPYLTGELDLPTTLTSIGESSFVGTNYTSVKLPNSLKTIGDYAFNNLPIQQRLVLPNRLTSVGAHAFDGTKITGLVIPDGVKSIGDGAFAETPIEGHVTIPDGITYLGEGAFRNTRISSVFLPNSVTTLCTGLFQGCSNLNLVYVPDNFTDMSNYAFDGCGALTTLRLSANTATMGEYSLQSTPLEYVKVPSQVEVLSKGVLKNCTKLESLSLPANLKTVEAEALYGCTALRNMSVEAITPPTIKNRSAIRGINTDKCLISIPTSAYRNYVLAEYWGQFVQMRNDIAVEITGNGEIAFESVTEEEEEEDVYEAKVRAVVEEEEEKVVVYEAPLRADVRRVAASVIGDEPKLMSMIEVDTDETPLSSDVRRVAAPAIRRAPQLATEEEPMTYANNGSSIYAPPNAKVLFHITPAEGKELLSATLDGEDIMPSIVNGIYTATADKKNAKLVVNFSGQSIAVLNGDANGDGTIDVTDIVAIANYILGRASSSFDEAAADVNGDGSVDVTDIVAVANIILRGTGQNNAKMHGDEEMLDPQ